MNNLKHIKIWVFFLFGFILLSSFLNFCYKYIVVTEAFPNQKEIDGLIEGATIETLIMGNSHSYQIQPAYFPNSFNYCSFGEGMVGSYYKLKYVIEKKKIKINNILIGYDVMDFSDFYYNYPERNYYYWAKIIDYWELGNETDKINENLFKWIRGKWLSYSDQDAIKNTVRYFQKKIKNAGPQNANNQIFKSQPLFMLSKIKSQPIEINSIKPKTTSIEALISEPFLNEREIWENKTSYFSIIEKEKFQSKHIRKYFKKFLELAQKNKINVFLIKYPKASAFSKRKAQKFHAHSFYNQLETEIKNFKNTYHILNYRDLYLEENLFMDGHHIKTGLREEFSNIVYKDMENKLEENDQL